MLLNLDFPWYEKLQKALREVFKIQEFRPYQLATMNATLSKQDAILIMPTGGGKSLSYQLTAVVDKGLCLVRHRLLKLFGYVCHCFLTHITVKW